MNFFPRNSKLYNFNGLLILLERIFMQLQLLVIISYPNIIHIRIGQLKKKQTMVRLIRLDKPSAIISCLVFYLFQLKSCTQLSSYLFQSHQLLTRSVLFEGQVYQSFSLCQQEIWSSPSVRIQRERTDRKKRRFVLRPQLSDWLIGIEGETFVLDGWLQNA